MDYAISTIELDGKKEFEKDDEYIFINGIASTPSTDRMGDVVEPLGAEFSLPMPLLWMHDSKNQIGHVIFAKPNKNGIPFKARLPIVEEDGLLKQQVDLAIHSLKYGFARSVSIGFRPIEWAWIKDSGGIHFIKWDWMELSLVYTPANSEAVLDTAKSIDRGVRAALGIKDLRRIDYLSSPGASGQRKGYRRPIQLIPAKR